MIEGPTGTQQLNHLLLVVRWCVPYRRYRQSDLVLLDIKINGEMVEPLACIVHRDAAYYVGKALVKRLKELIPRQQFRVPIQAAIGARVVASGACGRQLT